jgi:hypothetical protein
MVMFGAGGLQLLRQLITRLLSLHQKTPITAAKMPK